MPTLPAHGKCEQEDQERTQGKPCLHKTLFQKEKEDHVFSLKARHTDPQKSIRQWSAEKAQWLGALAALAKT